MNKKQAFINIFVDIIMDHVLVLLDTRIAQYILIRFEGNIG